MEHQVDPRLLSFAPAAASQSHPQTLTPLVQATAMPYFNIAPHNPVPQPNDEGLSNGTDSKRPRACESCRGLKVRCVFESDAPDATCKRCAKAKRKCVISAPTRRRQKKTDNRVAELEKKIDALTKTLKATRSGTEILSTENTDDDDDDLSPSTLGASSLTVESPVDDLMLRETMNSRVFTVPTMAVGHKRRRSEPRPHSDHSSTQVRSTESSSTEDPTTVYPFLVPKVNPSRNGSMPTPESMTSGYSHEYADAIDRRIITAETATMVFDRFAAEMAPIFPIITFKPGTTAAEVRKTKPILFLAVLAAGSNVLPAETQRNLTKEAYRVFAERIFCSGEKTLELVQALLVAVSWYWPPENFEELKFYQFIHVAAVMGIDIGINRKVRKPPPRTALGPGDSQWKKQLMGDNLQPDNIEARRTWLGCFYLCSNAAMSLRRPKLIHWTPYMTDCIEVIEKSPDASFHDRAFCAIVRMQRIADEVGTEFTMDDPYSSVSLADPRIQFALKGFERQIDAWKTGAAEFLNHPFMIMNVQVVIMYVHEIAMHYEGDDEGSSDAEKKATAQNKDEALSGPHVNALVATLQAAQTLINKFLSLDIDTTRNLPVFAFVRMSYATVALIKMFFAASVPHSNFAKVLSKDDINVPYFLDRLIYRYGELAENDRCRPAQKFSTVLLMLRQWLQKGTDLKKINTSHDAIKQQVYNSRTICEIAGEDYNDGRPTLPDQSAPNRDFNNAASPLHLLSEVASTGVTNSSGYVPTTSTTSKPAPTNGWYPITMEGISPMPPVNAATMSDAYGAQNDFLGAFNNTIDTIAPEANFGFPTDMSMFNFDQVDDATMKSIFEGFSFENWNA